MAQDDGGTGPERKPDPGDQEFGAAASRDAEKVDRLAREGVSEQELPDEPQREPGASGKAAPAGNES